MWKVEQVVWPSPWTAVPPKHTGDQHRWHHYPMQWLPVAAFIGDAHIRPQTESPLFRLPRELRDRIWSLALSTYCDEEKPYPRKIQVWRPDLTGPRRLDTALLETCRAVYMETWDRPIRQTTLVIHEGSEEDRPPPGLGRIHTRPSEWSFFLPAWQLLLLRHVDLTFQQIAMTAGRSGIEDWIARVTDAKRGARRIMRRIAPMVDEKNGKAGHSPVAVNFVENVLLPAANRGLKSLIVRVNRMDWWTWTDEPVTDKDLEDALTKGKVLNLPKPMLIFHPKSSEEADPDMLGLPADDFEFTLVLETWGGKLNQLNRVIDYAKEWTFNIPLRGDEGRGDPLNTARRDLVWDGQILDRSWLMQGRAGMMRAAWIPKETHIHARVIKYAGRAGARRSSS